MSATETTPAQTFPKRADRTAEDSPKIIRAWAKSVGLPVGERGRLNPATVQSYLKGDKRPAAKALAARQNTSPEVRTTREWATAQGLTVGKRGRLPLSVVAQHAESLTASAAE